MTQTEALRLALEALESNRRTHYYCEDTWYSCPKHEDGCANEHEGDECNCGADKANAGIDQAITAIKAALEAKDEPYGWKLVPIEPTDEMLKAMDECSTEGYDERLPAGIASSVYMAAVEVAPKPPKQEIKNEPKCVAIVEVFGKDWRLDYMALPVGKHKLYAQQYTYTTPPQRKPCGLECDCTDVCKQDDYKALWQQMCERCDELDKKLAQQEHGWTPERIAGMARLKAQQDKRLEPQRTWIGLDVEDYIKALELCDFDKDAAFDFFESKLKQKNFKE